MTSTEITKIIREKKSESMARENKRKLKKEDVFLQDETHEAEQLERVIEGDEFEERHRSDSDDNSEKEDEAEEDKKRVDPTKPKSIRVVKNPRFLLNPARLTGPRGIQVIPDHFKDFKFKGKGHEKEDLDLVLKKLEHWAYRLYPKFQFEDCLKKIEMLGKKRPVAVHLHKIRSDQFLSEDAVVQKDSSDEDTPMPVQEEDEFDKLLQQQIELARSTPAPSSAKKPGFGASSPPKDNRIPSVMMPKATSSPSINDEQRERMLRSRKLAEERRLARLKNATNTITTVGNIPGSQSVNTESEPTVHTIDNTEKYTDSINKDTEEIGVVRKHNRSNVIDSSDEEDAVDTNMSISVDVHAVNRNQVNNNSIRNSESNINNTGDFKEIVDIDDKSEETDNVRESNLNIDTNITSKFDMASEKGTLEDNISEESGIREDFSDNNVNEKISHENSEAIDKSVVENSDDLELRYDDCDAKVDIEQSNSDKNNENTISNSSHKEIIDMNNENNTEDSVEQTDSVEKVVASEDVIEDVMDVDFTEDF